MFLHDRENTQTPRTSASNALKVMYAKFHDGAN
jgi:hypothetical protein